MLQTMKQELAVYDYSRDLGHSERRLHVIANQMLSYNYFVISSSIFQKLFTLLAKEKALYYRSLSLFFNVITKIKTNVDISASSPLPTVPQLWMCALSRC